MLWQKSQEHSTKLHTYTPQTEGRACLHKKMLSQFWDCSYCGTYSKNRAAKLFLSPSLFVAANHLPLETSHTTWLGQHFPKFSSWSLSVLHWYQYSSTLGSTGINSSTGMNLITCKSKLGVKLKLSVSNLPGPEIDI